MDTTHILITGASSGIGEALAKFYAGPGVRLSLLARDETRLNAVKQVCLAKGSEVKVVTADVTDQAALETSLTALDQELAIDMMILNAGGSQKQAKVEGESRGRNLSVHVTELHLVQVHLQGMLNSLHPVLVRMQSRKRGKVIFMASLNAFVVIPRSAIYGAVKAAVLHYGLAQRVALAKDNIQVSVLCPGWVESALTALNTFPMPGLISSERAAKLIATGIEKNKAVIGFPFKTYWIARLYQVLPLWLRMRLSRIL